MRYVRGNRVYGREFLHYADPDHQTRHWLDGVASVRVHATTRERPRVRFDRDERLLLRPLAPPRYTSLVLDSPSPASPRQKPRPVIDVQKRSLAVYAQLAGGVA